MLNALSLRTSLFPTDYRGLRMSLVQSHWCTGACTCPMSQCMNYVHFMWALTLWRMGLVQKHFLSSADAPEINWACTLPLSRCVDYARGIMWLFLGTLTLYWCIGDTKQYSYTHDYCKNFIQSTVCHSPLTFQNTETALRWLQWHSHLFRLTFHLQRLSMLDSKLAQAKVQHPCLPEKEYSAHFMVYIACIIYIMCQKAFMGCIPLKSIWHSEGLTVGARYSKCPHQYPNSSIY